MSAKEARDPFAGLTGPARRSAVLAVRSDILAARMRRAARVVVAKCALRGVA